MPVNGHGYRTTVIAWCPQPEVPPPPDVVTLLATLPAVRPSGIRPVAPNDLDRVRSSI
jgi:hypothetical protein